MNNVFRVLETFVHFRSRFLGTQLETHVEAHMLRHTSTLRFISAIIVSIIIVPSSCCEQSGIAPATDDNEVAYQEVVDMRFEFLCTFCYFTSILICLKKANECSLSLNLLKICCYFVDQTAIPHGH